MFCVFGLQHCKIYLCATKNDLVQGDRSLRKIDFHDAQDFAEGICGSDVRCDVPRRFFPAAGEKFTGSWATASNRSCTLLSNSPYYSLYLILWITSIWGLLVTRNLVWDFIERGTELLILQHLTEVILSPQRSAGSILRPPVKQEVTWVSCALSHANSTFNPSRVYSCVSRGDGGGGGGGCVNVGTHSSRLTDEMFQKLAEDYNNSAFQYMTGQ